MIIFNLRVQFNGFHKITIIYKWKCKENNKGVGKIIHLISIFLRSSKFINNCTNYSFTINIWKYVWIVMNLVTDLVFFNMEFLFPLKHTCSLFQAELCAINKQWNDVLNTNVVRGYLVTLRLPFNLTPWLMKPGCSIPHSKGLSNNLYSESN